MALLSVSAWGALVCLVLGIFSVGLLYLVPFGLALTVLGRVLGKRLEFADLVLAGGALVVMVWGMTEGLQLFPLA